MGMSAGDEKRIKREIATKPGMYEIPAMWLREIYGELDYHRKMAFRYACPDATKEVTE